MNGFPRRDPPQDSRPTRGSPRCHESEGRRPPRLPPRSWHVADRDRPGAGNRQRRPSQCPGTKPARRASTMNFIEARERQDVARRRVESGGLAYFNRNRTHKAMPMCTARIAERRSLQWDPKPAESPRTESVRPEKMMDLMSTLSGSFDGDVSAGRVGPGHDRRLRRRRPGDHFVQAAVVARGLRADSLQHPGRLRHDARSRDRRDDHRGSQGGPRRWP